MVAELAKLKAQMPTLSTEGEAVVLAQGNHHTTVTDRDQAADVADAILDVLP